MYPSKGSPLQTPTTHGSGGVAPSKREELTFFHENKEQDPKKKKKKTKRGPLYNSKEAYDLDNKKTGKDRFCWGVTGGELEWFGAQGGYRGAEGPQKKFRVQGCL